MWGPEREEGEERRVGGGGGEEQDTGEEEVGRRVAMGREVDDLVIQPETPESQSMSTFQTGGSRRTQHAPWLRASHPRPASTLFHMPGGRRSRRMGRRTRCDHRGELGVKQTEDVLKHREGNKEATSEFGETKHSSTCEG